jgi:NAD(P)-dependent dehydrogenase (short-subunit alcohol dehydrogenase family)
MMGSTSKNWFITGISKGLGTEIARAALDAGHTVIGTVRTGTVPADLTSPRLHVLKLDVTDESAVHAAVKQAIALANGHVDVVVNNAGFVVSGAIEEVSIKQIKQQYDANLYGAIAVTQAFLPHLRKQGSGHILQVSSLFGRTSAPGWGVYCSSKYALEAMSEALALEVEKFGIHVTLVQPGYVRTPILASGTYYGDNPLPHVYDGIRYGAKEIAAIDGKQSGDPARMARAIVQITTVPMPPLHFPLGPDSYNGIKQALGQIIKDIEEYKDISISTDYPA